MAEEKSKTSAPMVIGLLLVLLGLAGILNIVAKNVGPQFSTPPGVEPGEEPVTPDAGDTVAVTPYFEGFEKFISENEFKEYAERNKEDGYYSGAWGRGVIMKEAMDTDMAVQAPMAKGLDESGGGSADRVSDTNVQVVGIDEPDIVKTNGKEIYFSSTQNYYWRGFAEIMPRIKEGQTRIINAFPPADLDEIGEIEKAGNLLLSGDILAIFSDDKIIGYDISKAKKPSKEWEVKLEDNNHVVSSRLYKEKIYLITRQSIQLSKPCPIRPLSVDGDAVEVKCVDIYHPVVDSPVDSTYTVLALDIKNGKVKNKVSFVGKASSSVTYMSENALYMTYSLPGDFVKFFYNFLTEDTNDLVGETSSEKIRKLVGYDISPSSKLNELEIILDTYYNSLSGDERLRIQNEFNNRLQDYYKEHNRELEKTGIVKVSVDDLKVESVGEVPGSPLNQFSLDEYEEHLRIAVTIGQQWSRFGRLGESVSDVYVLDKNLKTTGSVKGMGEGERIYSVRFLQDKGYVVTFRETDPFYVLDLSDPDDPALEGELKIPGYSSYLHPITKDKILGIGKEGLDVKVSLFDVTNSEHPTEAAKYALEEYWSDILNTYHAFLLDSKHEIFFLPGQRGGYVFSYSDDKLSLKKAISDISARRALYLNDYLYIVGDDEIVVLNEIDWQEVNSLDLE